MRYIVNISLPESMAKEVNVAVKNGPYATKSEFFRDLLRDWKERELLKGLQQSRKDIKNKKGRVLKSLKDMR